jgi:hypothetical protein
MTIERVEEGRWAVRDKGYWVVFEETWKGIDYVIIMIAFVLLSGRE